MAGVFWRFSAVPTGADGLSRGFSAAKREEWSARLARFAKTKQTVGEFCLEEGVSPPSFYRWKQRLLTSRVASPTPAAQASSRFQAVEIISPPQVGRRETIIRLGQGIQIELGSDLAVVEVVVHQLLEVACGAKIREGEPC